MAYSNRLARRHRLLAMHVKTRIRSAKANDHGSLASGCYEIGRIAEDLGDDSTNNSFLVGFAKCLDSREFVYTCRMYATFKEYKPPLDPGDCNGFHITGGNPILLVFQSLVAF